MSGESHLRWRDSRRRSCLKSGYCSVRVVAAEHDQEYATMGIATSTVDVVTVNVGVDKTPVRPLREEWDRQGVVADMEVSVGRDVEVPHLVPGPAQERGDSTCTCRRRYIPSVGNQGTEIGEVIAVEARYLGKKREQGPEGGNSLRSREAREDGPVRWYLPTDSRPG